MSYLKPSLICLSFRPNNLSIDKLVYISSIGEKPKLIEIFLGRFTPFNNGELIFVRYPPTQYLFLNPPIIPKSNPILEDWCDSKPPLPLPDGPAEFNWSQIKKLALTPTDNDEFLSFL